ncbi:MAG TPA: lactonase family protein [Isosphaeraceae bacterium]|jgi:6-phosphogluconolactonase|nr:lactonase family protein [Isosphaeraceae bacterium]
MSLSLFLAAALSFAPPPDDASTRVYIGTYTDGGKSKGIYTFELDPKTGAVSSPRLAAESPNPSFLAPHPNGKSLYAANEVDQFRGRPGGSVTGFAIDAADGRLSTLNASATRGEAPCHLSIDRAGRTVLVANYGGGNLAAIPIGADGRFDESKATDFHKLQGQGPNRQRQEKPHAHWIDLDAADRFAIAADLGTDSLWVFRFDPKKGTLTPNDPPAARVAPGSGPRHFAFHPDGRHGFVNNEMASTVTAFDYDPEKGTLKTLQTLSTLPDGFQGESSTAEIAVHPNGRFLYVSNRGHDSLAIFAIDKESGKLKAIGHTKTGGRTLRNFAIDPTGRWLLAANQDSDSVVVFTLDPDTGRLTPTPHKAEVPKPVCVVFLPRK